MQSATDVLLTQVQDYTKGYKHVNITNFTTSWSNGLAFCSLLHSFNNTLFSYDDLKPGDPEKNLNLAFSTARKLGIPPLLDVEDMFISIPDPLSVVTYVSEICSFFRKKSDSIKFSEVVKGWAEEELIKSERELKIETVQRSPSTKASKCVGCGLGIVGESLLLQPSATVSTPIEYHPSCFVCRTCDRLLDAYVRVENSVYCELCGRRAFVLFKSRMKKTSSVSRGHFSPVTKTKAAPARDNTAVVEKKLALLQRQLLAPSNKKEADDGEKDGEKEATKGKSVVEIYHMRRLEEARMKRKALNQRKAVSNVSSPSSSNGASPLVNEARKKFQIQSSSPPAKTLGKSTFTETEVDELVERLITMLPDDLSVSSEDFVQVIKRLPPDTLNALSGQLHNVSTKSPSSARSALASNSATSGSALSKDATKPPLEDWIKAAVTIEAVPLVEAIFSLPSISPEVLFNSVKTVDPSNSKTFTESKSGGSSPENLIEAAVKTANETLLRALLNSLASGKRENESSLLKGQQSFSNTQESARSVLGKDNLLSEKARDNDVTPSEKGKVGLSYSDTSVLSSVRGKEFERIQAKALEVLNSEITQETKALAELTLACTPASAPLINIKKERLNNLNNCLSLLSGFTAQPFQPTPSSEIPSINISETGIVTGPGTPKKGIQTNLAKSPKELVGLDRDEREEQETIKRDGEERVFETKEEEEVHRELLVQQQQLLQQLPPTTRLVLKLKSAGEFFSALATASPSSSSSAPITLNYERDMGALVAGVVLEGSAEEEDKELLHLIGLVGQATSAPENVKQEAARGILALSQAQTFLLEHLPSTALPSLPHTLAKLFQETADIDPELLENDNISEQEGSDSTRSLETLEKAIENAADILLGGENVNPEKKKAVTHKLKEIAFQGAKLRNNEASNQLLSSLLPSSTSARETADSTGSDSPKNQRINIHENPDDDSNSSLRSRRSGLGEPVQFQREKETTEREEEEEEEEAAEEALENQRLNVRMKLYDRLKAIADRADVENKEDEPERKKTPEEEEEEASQQALRRLLWKNERDRLHQADDEERQRLKKLRQKARKERWDQIKAQLREEELERRKRDQQREALRKEKQAQLDLEHKANLRKKELEYQDRKRQQEERKARLGSDEPLSARRRDQPLLTPITPNINPKDVPDRGIGGLYRSATFNTRFSPRTFEDPTPRRRRNLDTGPLYVDDPDWWKRFYKRKKNLQTRRENARLELHALKTKYFIS